MRLREVIESIHSPIYAGKFAWSLKFEDELVQEDQDRGTRNTEPYVPTFFTAPHHHAALTAAARPHQPLIRQQPQQPQQPLRPQREVQYEAPLYYQQ